MLMPYGSFYSGVISLFAAVSRLVICPFIEDFQVYLISMKTLDYSCKHVVVVIVGFYTLIEITARLFADMPVICV